MGGKLQISLLQVPNYNDFDCIAIDGKHWLTLLLIHYFKNWNQHRYTKAESMEIITHFLNSLQHLLKCFNLFAGTFWQHLLIKYWYSIVKKVFLRVYFFLTFGQEPPIPPSCWGYSIPSKPLQNVLPPSLKKLTMWTFCKTLGTPGSSTYFWCS